MFPCLSSFYTNESACLTPACLCSCACACCISHMWHNLHAPSQLYHQPSHSLNQLSCSMPIHACAGRRRRNAQADVNTAQKRLREAELERYLSPEFVKRYVQYVRRHRWVGKTQAPCTCRLWCSCVHSACLSQLSIFVHEHEPLRTSMHSMWQLSCRTTSGTHAAQCIWHGSCTCAV